MHLKLRICRGIPAIRISLLALKNGTTSPRGNIGKISKNEKIQPRLTSLQLRKGKRNQKENENKNDKKNSRLPHR